MATIAVYFVHATTTLQSCIEISILRKKVKTAKNDIIRKIVQRDAFLLLNQSRKKQNMPILTLILEYNEF